MPKDIINGLKGNLFVLVISLVLIIFLHYISKRRLHKKGLSNQRLMAQWGDLIEATQKTEERLKQVRERIEKKVVQAKKVEYGVVRVEPDWNSGEEVCDFIEELHKEKEDYIKDEIKKEIYREGKTKEQVIASCKAVLNWLRRTRNTLALGWIELQKKLSELPPRLIAFLMAWLRKTNQITLISVQGAHSFLIEIRDDKSCIECLETVLI